MTITWRHTMYICIKRKIFWAWHVMDERNAQRCVMNDWITDSLVLAALNKWESNYRRVHVCHIKLHRKGTMCRRELQTRLVETYLNWQRSDQSIWNGQTLTIGHKGVFSWAYYSCSMVATSIHEQLISTLNILIFL